MSLLGRLAAFLGRFWKIAAPTPLLWLRPARKRASGTPADVANLGSHWHLGDLLVALDDYFDDLERMRTFSPEMYGYFREVGASVSGSSSDGAMEIIDFFDLPASWRDGVSPRSSIGMWHFRNCDTKKSVFTAFMYFQKFQRRPLVEPTEPGHDVYECILLWRWKKHRLGGGTFHVGVSPAGEITLLRQYEARRHELPRKKCHLRGVIRNGSWQKPAFLHDFARVRPDDEPNHPLHGQTVEVIAKRLFCAAVSGAVYAHSDGFQVLVTKNGRSARFNVNMLRTPHFFADREKTVTENGSTRRIFHIVRAHKRVMAGGAEKWIKSHFRGLRFFRWNGYDVLITMPGLHHKPVEDWDGAAFEEDDPLAPDVDAIGMPEAGKKISRYMRRSTHVQRTRRRRSLAPQSGTRLGKT